MRRETGPISTKPSLILNPDNDFFDRLALQFEKITVAQPITISTELQTTANSWVVTNALLEHPLSNLKRPVSRAAYQALEHARNTNQHISDKALHHLLKLITTDRYYSTEKWVPEEQVKLLKLFQWDNPAQIEPDQKAMLQTTVQSMASHIYATDFDDLAKDDPDADPSKIFKKACMIAAQHLPKAVREAYEYKPTNKNKPSWQFGKEKIVFDSRDEAVVGYLLNKYKIIKPKQGITVHVGISTTSRHSLDFYVPWAQTFIEFHPLSRGEAISKIHHTDTIEERTMRINRPLYQNSEVLHIWQLDQLYDVVELLETKGLFDQNPKLLPLSKEQFYSDLNSAKSIFF